MVERLTGRQQRVLECVSQRYALAIIACTLTMGGAMLAGCNQAGSGTQPRGLLVSAGFGSASDVSFAVLQPGSILKVTDAAAVAQLYNAVNQPDRDFTSKMARNRLLAFVGSNGSTALVAYSDSGDLTAHQGSSKLIPLVKPIYSSPACKDTARIPIRGLSGVRVVEPGRIPLVSPKSGPKWRSARASAAGLIQLWNPDDLHGCRRVGRRDVDALSSRYVEVEFSRAVAFRTFMAPRGFEWWPPPESVETRVRYEEVRSKLVRALSVQPGQMRLAFEIDGGGAWVLSPVLATRRFLGFTQQGRSRFGADQFEEVISAATKP